MIELMLRQMIKKYKDDPKRSVRNIVDMALNFCKGGFQCFFFETAQKMLNNRSSAYYELTDNLLIGVDADRLIRFGMNIGYNSCTKGAELIRQIEAAEHFDIPWSMTLEINERGDSEFVDDYIKLIEQGKELGIYTWVMELRSRPRNVLTAIAKNPECAFVLIVSPEMITDELLDQLSPLYNIMLCVRCGEGVENACRKIHDRKMLCSVYFEYNESSIDSILSSSNLQQVKLMQPAFCIVDPEKACGVSVREKAARCIADLRNSQHYPFILLENKNDTKMIDTVISNTPCSAFFDENGDFRPLFRSCSNEAAENELNFRSCTLRDILAKAFSRTQ